MKNTGHLLYFLIPARHTGLGIKSHQLCGSVIAKELKTKRLGKRQGKFTRHLISQSSTVQDLKPKVVKGQTNPYWNTCSNLSE